MKPRVMKRDEQAQRPVLDFDVDLAKFTERQMEVCGVVDRREGKYILFGGSLGGGKSYLLRWMAVRLLMVWYYTKGLTYVQVMLACEDYPSLKDRQLTRIAREFPEWLGKSYTDHKDYGRCFILNAAFGSGVICFRNLDDASKYQCFHPDTEILTDGGWVDIKRVRVGDRAATMDPETRVVEYRGVSRAWDYDFDGELETMRSRGTPSFAVTPNHTIWASTCRVDKLRPYRADELPVTAKIPQWAIWPDGGGLKGPVRFGSDGNNGRAVVFDPGDWMEFLGWYLAEGCVESAPRFAIHISQVNESGRERIISLLKRNGVNYHVNEREINFNNKALNAYLSVFGKSHGKYIPREMMTLPKELLFRMLWSLVEGDGTWINGKTGHFVSSSRRLADDVSEIALRCGYRPTISLRHDKPGENPYGDGHKPRYHVHLTAKSSDTRCGHHRKREKYKGRVYCVTVPPYHLVLTRHGGRVSWSGQSSEFAAVLVDELTKNGYDVFNDLRMRLRWPGLSDEETFFIGATNPGGIGHSYCRALWIDRIYPDEFRSPVDYTGKFAFIRSKADDNPHLDASYWQMLQTLPVHLRAAFRDGSWDTFVGQSFQEWSRVHHVIKPLPVPKGVPVFMTFDWGFGAPFSVNWCWLDSDGRVYLFAEWYGWNGTPNQGLRLADSEIAEGIIKREASMGYSAKDGKVVNPQIIRLCDPTCFNKKPDYRGGGQGRSTADEFRAMGLYMRPGDPSRALKMRQFHERLRVPEDGGVPMLQVYDTCQHFIRTIPNLVVNPNNPEDIETDSEDHCYDSLCHVFMARPMQLAGQSAWKETLSGSESRRKPPRDISEVARRELEDIWSGQHGETGQWNYY